jgi:hypothetical protein
VMGGVREVIEYGGCSSRRINANRGLLHEV